MILSIFWYYVSNHILLNCYSLAVHLLLCEFVTYLLLNTEYLGYLNSNNFFIYILVAVFARLCF